MKITPIEIRQKTFERVLRGYDKEEVNAFLQSLSQEWERVLEENREYRFKLEVTQKEVQKLREVETSLYRTLKTAEDTSTQLIEQAGRSADLQVREARSQAEAMLNDARTKAAQLTQEAEKHSRRTLEDTLAEVKGKENDLRQLEMLKENLIQEIRNIANDTVDRINRVAERNNRNLLDEKIREVRNLLDQKPAPVETAPPVVVSQEPPATTPYENKPSAVHPTAETDGNQITDAVYEKAEAATSENNPETGRTDALAIQPEIKIEPIPAPAPMESFVVRKKPAEQFKDTSASAASFFEEI